MAEFTPVPKPPKREKKAPKRIRPKSKKLVKKDEVWGDVRQIVLARDKYQCVAKVSQYCSKNGEHIHHLLRRSAGGSHEPENLISLCAACHGWVHNHPAESRARGWLASRYGVEHGDSDLDGGVSGEGMDD